MDFCITIFRFLLNGIICDYALHLIVSMMQPVTLFPFYMAYMNGVFKYFITQQGVYILLAIMIVIYINIAENQFFSFLYRLAHISPFGAVEFFEVGFKKFTKNNNLVILDATSNSSYHDLRPLAVLYLCSAIGLFTYNFNGRMD